MSPAPRIRSLALARAAVGVVAGGALGAAAFLIVCTSAERVGLTALRVGHALEVLTGGPGYRPEVVQLVSPRGIYASLIVATVLVGIHAAVLGLSRRRSWRVGAAALAVAMFVLAGLVFGPLVEARVSPHDAVAGVFGIDAGRWTPLWLAVASLAFGIVGARVYALMGSRAWWADADAPGDRGASGERHSPESGGGGI